MNKQREIKDCMFQYADRNKIYENTDLITRAEADELVEKWKDHLIKNWNEDSAPQFVIWVDCESNTNYHTMGLSIDFDDCVFENGHFYKVTKERIL